MENDDQPDENSTAEALKRVYDPTTYTTPLPRTTDVYTVPLHRANADDTMTEIGIEEIELDRFLETFSVREKTEEIVEIMCHTPGLKALFEELVPTVTCYPDFWTRFYFRCDPDRIRRIRCSIRTSAGPDQHTDSQKTEEQRPPPSIASVSSPTSVVDHFELDGLQILKNLSLEGL